MASMFFNAWGAPKHTTTQTQKSALQQKLDDLNAQLVPLQNQLKSKSFLELVGDSLIKNPFDKYSGGETGRIQRQIDDVSKQIRDLMHSDEYINEAKSRFEKQVPKTATASETLVDYDKQLADTKAQMDKTLNEWNNLSILEKTQQAVFANPIDDISLYHKIMTNNPVSKYLEDTLGGKGSELLKKYRTLIEHYKNLEYEKKRHNTINELGNVYFTGEVNNASAENVGASIKDTSGIKGIVKYITDSSYKDQVDKNIQNNAGSQFAPTAIAAAGDYYKYTPADFMTDADKKILTYYASKGDWDSAQKYYDAIKRDLNAKRQAYESGFYEQFSNEHKAAGATLNILSSVGEPASYIATLGQNVKNLVTGEYEPVDPNTAAFMFSHAAQDTEKGVTKDMSVVGKLATDTGLSIGKMAITLPFGKTASLAIMSSEAAGQTALQATQNGASPSQALELATIAGAVEYATEKIPLENLFKIMDGGKQPLVQLLKSSVKQGAIQIPQEVISDYANSIADQLIMGDKSQYNQLAKQYQEQGMSEEEAKRKAFIQIYAINPALSGAAGFVSGLAMGTGANIVGNISAPKAQNTELNIDSNTIDSAVMPQEGVLATQQAEDIQTPVQTQIAPRANAEEQGAVGNAAKAETQSVVLKIRESIPFMDVDEPVSILTGNEFSKGTKKLSEQVIDFFSKFGNKVTRRGFGDVVIDSESVGADIGHGIGRAKAITFASVPDVISRGVQIDYQPNWKGRGADSYVFAAPVDIGGNKTYVGVVVLSDSKNHFYLHEVVDANGNIIYIKNNDAGTIKTGVTVQDGLTSSPASLSDTNIPQNVNGVKQQGNTSSAGNMSIPVNTGIRTHSGSTYESLSDPRALELLERYNSNVPKTQAEKREELARLYAALVAEQQAGKTAVEKDTGQGYNGNWDRLYDENVQGTEGSNGRTAEGAGKTVIDSVPKTRVGQWMSKAEYEQFLRTGEIPRTNVLTNGMDGYIKQANKGDYYVEFDIDSSLLVPKNEALGWSLIKPKNQMYIKLYRNRGLILPDPIGTNIAHVYTK